jgi:HSP20 family protein
MLNLLPRQKKKEQPLARLRDEFETLLNRFLGPGGNLSSSSENDQDLLSGLDVEDRDNEIVLRGDLPGFEPSEIDTQLSGQILTIKAEKERKKSKGKGNGDGEEHEYRFFQESVMLPEGVKADQIQAKYRNGVLEIHVPKSEQSKAKRIAVKG